MRWRLLPGLKLDQIRRCKCLLIGSGTLGCNVARSLLAWGVPEINFIDNGKVSYSNPVRQTLFTFEDSLNGRDKATAAAARLREIFPGVKSEGYVFSIPMPGHDFTSSEEADSIENAVLKLDQLIKDHDVTFLLTDSKESRWLPTVIAARYDKMLINAALGFDTLVVMRHGGGFQQCDGESNTMSSTSVSNENSMRLGCYFCNDIVAPIDTTRDRTLDQQCTVTRPALSFIASSLAVEFMVSLLHHEDKHKAPVDTSDNLPTSTNNADINDRPLGLLPQQVRFFLTTYKMILPTVYAFNQCTACSKKVVDEYEKNNVSFVQNVVRCLNGEYLEKLVGVSELLIDPKMDDVISLDSEDEG